MEVITEITQLHYHVFVVLGIISIGIMILFLFKKFQDLRHFEQGRRNEIEKYLKKFEFSFKKIIERIDDTEKFSRNKEFDKMTLEILAIRSIATHQLGHFVYVRDLLLK